MPQPIIKDDEVLVQVKVISINPADAFVRKDAAALKYVLQLKEGEQPIIIGWDISRTVTQVGKAVTAFKKGDEVFGLNNFLGHGKGYAEYVGAHERNMAIKPNNTLHEEAAAATIIANILLGPVRGCDKPLTAIRDSNLVYDGIGIGNVIVFIHG